ncbi:D-2-hydroxyacid dehydrogenase [Halostella sp. JP-L12]|uniref:D-2-hydroxyacid dehydrogenase n=1 Tax=Halostella TaxID=1843185 RepID=UPI000EF7B455|nr:MULTISPECIES: D-2-hydroxyacid dehydrogenase [Halostella]NHN48155.1 D-2-hydroxyacid dehydrogenase [Halostella sp. JP-L12]
MQLRRLGINDSVSAVFPPDRLESALADLPVEVAVVGDDRGDLAECDGVVTFAHRESYLDTVDWVHSIQAGVDRFPVEEFEARDIALTNSTGIHDDTVGEFVAGYMLMIARRHHEYARKQARKEWAHAEWDAPFTLAGESLCVVGLGTLGRGIAERADALGMEVTGVKRTPEDVPGVSTVYPGDELREAVADAKFVALAVPLTDETEGLIGKDEFDALRDDAYLINVARGPVVRQQELVRALERGDLAGAALDVFEEEPLPDRSPLWEMDEVIVTPHAAAQTRDYYRDIADLVRENVDRIQSDEELYNRVV